MKDIVLTDKGPKPIGPYSQAVKSNGFLFASGQVALDPRTNEFIGGDIRQQTERAMENIKAVIEAAGSNLHHVVKTTVFLKDMNDFAAMNEAYTSMIKGDVPTRVTVGAQLMAADNLVEMSMLAILP